MKKKSNFILYTIVGFFSVIIFLASCNSKKYDLDDIMIRTTDSVVCLRSNFEPISGELNMNIKSSNNIFNYLFLSDQNLLSLNIEDIILNNSTDVSGSSYDELEIYNLFTSKFRWEYAFKDAQDLYQKINKTLITYELFENSLNNNLKFLSDSYNLFKEEGYTNTIDDYQLLLGVGVVNLDGKLSDLEKKNYMKLLYSSIIYDSKIINGGSNVQFIDFSHLMRSIDYKKRLFESIMRFNEENDVAHFSLYSKMKSHGLYSKSYDNFKKESLSKLFVEDSFTKLRNQGHYTKSYYDFNYDYIFQFSRKTLMKEFIKNETFESFNRKTAIQIIERNLIEDDSLKILASFDQGKLNGEISGIYLSGEYTNQIFFKENYKNSFRNGLSKFWYTNGSLRAEISFNKNILNRVFNTYYDNGNPHIQMKFSEGKAIGKKEEFYYDGGTMLEANYKNGVLDGDYKIWDINGERVVWKYYNNGIEEEYKYEEGNEVGIEESYKKKNKKGKADEIEVFDQLNKHYTNYLYGVGFDAPDNWIREEASGKHSILKISHPDSVLMFVINVVEVKKIFNENNDINSWTNFDQKNQEMYQTLVQLGKGPLDTDIRNYKCEKEYLLNHKAFKCQYEITRKYADNEYDVVKITYQIQKGNMSYTFLFDVPLVFYETNPEYYDSVFEYAYFID